MLHEELFIHKKASSVFVLQNSFQKGNNYGAVSDNRNAFYIRTTMVWWLHCDVRPLIVSLFLGVFSSPSFTSQDMITTRYY